MSPLVPYSNISRKGGILFVTVDALGRLCLSSALQRELDCVKSPIELYVAYDKVNKRIGLAKPAVVRLTGTNPYKFDRRSYANAQNFLKANQVAYEGGGQRYIFDGKENGWLTFKLAGYEAPDQPGQTV